MHIFTNRLLHWNPGFKLVLSKNSNGFKFIRISSHTPKIIQDGSAENICKDIDILSNPTHQPHHISWKLEACKTGPSDILCLSVSPVRSLPLHSNKPPQDGFIVDRSPWSPPRRTSPPSCYSKGEGNENHNMAPIACQFWVSYRWRASCNSCTSNVESLAVSSTWVSAKGRGSQPWTWYRPSPSHPSWLDCTLLLNLSFPSCQSWQPVNLLLNILGQGGGEAGTLPRNTFWAGRRFLGSWLSETQKLNPSYFKN